MATTTATKVGTLESYETVIATGEKSFAKIGEALKAIRDNRLYSKKYGKGVGWKSYLATRWNYSEAFASRLIQAYDVTLSLEKQGVSKDELPKTESATRELAKTPAIKQKEVLKKANATAKAKGKATSAKDIKEARDGKGNIVKGNFQDRKDAMNSKVKGKTYDLKAFRDELSGLIAIYRTYGLDKGGIIAELEATATILRSEKVNVKKVS